MNSDDHAPEGFWRRALAAGAGYHLLVLLLIVFILQPLVGTRVNTKLMEAFTAGVFGLALAAVASHRRVLLAGVLLFVPTVVMGQLSVGSGALDGLARDLLSVAFLALMIGAFRRPSRLEATPRP